jgi:hypothetical protein
VQQSHPVRFLDRRGAASPRSDVQKSRDARAKGRLDYRRVAVGCALACAALLASRRACAVGATVAFTSYEAEAGTLIGAAAVRKLAAPVNTNWSSPELEASGRAFVELKATGDGVTLPNNTGTNVTALDVRYSIPDAAKGGGITSTLSVYVNGVFRQSVPVSSRQTWLYSGTEPDGMNQDPSLPNPHIFFEEAHFWLEGAAIAPGSTITLKRDAADSAGFYWIDVVDLEAPPAAQLQPADSISILDYGAVSTDPVDGPIPASAADSTAAIQKAIDAASAQKKALWIPSGRFIIGAAGLHATGITLAGAGMWYSTLYRNLALPYAGGTAPPLLQVTSVTLRDFFLDSNSVSRKGEDGDSAGVNISGQNWLVERLWIQHTSSGVWGKGENGMVRDCRVLSTWGDGVNLNNGNTGNKGNRLSAENNYVRGVGDDGVTINSDVTSEQMDTVTLRGNTTVSIYWADGLRVAGGRNILVENNLLCDPVNFPGLIVGVFNGAALESGIVQNNTIVRGGGDVYNQHKAALMIGTGSPGAVTVSNVKVTGNVVVDSMQKAIEIASSKSITLTNNLVDGLWLNPASPTEYVSLLDVASGAEGSATVSENTFQNQAATTTTFVNRAGSAKFPITGNGNVGFDPTVAGPSTWGNGSGKPRLPLGVTSCTSSPTATPSGGGSGGLSGAGGSVVGGGGSGANAGDVAIGGALTAGGTSAAGSAGSAGTAGSLPASGAGGVGVNGRGGSNNGATDGSGCSCAAVPGRPGSALFVLLPALATLWHRRQARQASGKRARRS